MPTRGASPIPSPDLNLLDERRSAHASIRGYLYQTCLGVLRWLDLQPNEILLCEGDEDLDRFLLNGGAVSEQVKAYTGGLSITDRVVRDSLRNFLRSYVTLRQLGENRKFVFTTTAYEKKRRTDGLDFDLLEKWRDGTRIQKVIKSVRSLVKPDKKDKKRKEIEEALAWLDEQDGGWSGFMDAVEWSFSAPELDALRDQIERKLMADRAAAVPAQLLDRLIVHVLRTSSRGEVKERILTREILDTQISTFLADLSRWAGSPEGLRIRTVFDEIDRLRNLLDEGTRELPANPTPGQILTAAYEVIPFDEVGRSEELDFLASWCESEDRRSVLLLTGEGGSGKTRLMLEWCRRLRHQGWHAGFLMRNREKEQILPLLKGTAPRLVVIDYAETRLGVVEPLLIEMGQAPQREGPKLRVVLLARREADWWKNLVQLTGDVESLLGDSKPRKISTLIPQNLGERQQAFQSATTGFSEALDCKIPINLYAPDLSGASFDRVLYLHMAAYLALYGERIETGEDALRQTLNHERRFWGQHDRTLKEALESAVAAVTLVGGVATFQQAKALLDRVLPPFSLEPREVRTLQNTLQNLYRSFAELYLDPLQPDLLGEQLIMEVLACDNELLQRLLEGASLEQSYAILTSLNRLAQRRADQQRWLAIALQGRLKQLALIAYEVTIHTGDPIGLELARELEGAAPIEVILSLHRFYISQVYRDSVPLREVIVVVTRKLVEFLRGPQKGLSHAMKQELAGQANNLGLQLKSLGHPEEALTASEEAVKLFRALAKRKPAALPGLSMSLNNLGSVLSHLGRFNEALKAAEQAVNINRRLAKKQRSDIFLQGWAMSLDNLAGRLSDLGRYEEALLRTQEAVEIFKKIAHRKPNVFLPDLALGLTNLGVRFLQLGRLEDALVVSQGANEIWSQLAEERPDVFLPKLAQSLSNLGLLLGRVGDLEGEIFEARKSADIFRSLAERRPEAFLPDLALALNNLGSGLMALERLDDALSVTQESVDIRRELVKKRPESFYHPLAKSLGNLGEILRRLRRLNEALTATQEAVGILRHLATLRPISIRPDLKDQLENLALIFTQLGQLEIALDHIRESVDLARQLAEERPEAFLAELALCLSKLGTGLSDLGKHEDAFSAAQEAVQILSPSFLRSPTTFAALTAMMVGRYLVCAEAIGVAPDEALLAPVLEVFESLRASEEPAP